MTEPKPAYDIPVTALPYPVRTDAHLSDLLELRTIAAGTQTEAYAWPKLIKRLGEMIAQRAAALASAEQLEGGDAGIG